MEETRTTLIPQIRLIHWYDTQAIRGGCSKAEAGRITAENARVLIEDARRSAEEARAAPPRS